MIIVYFIGVLLLIFIIRFFVTNRSKDNLMKQYDLPLEDRLALLEKYGISGINKRFYHEFNENAKLANKIGYVFRTTF